MRLRPQLTRPAAQPNPFGAARPREAVIAERTGVKESDVVKTEAAAWKPSLRLSREQSDDKQALEDEIKFAQKELTEAGDDAGKAAAAKEALAAKEAELAKMMDGFEARRPAATRARARRASTVGSRRFGSSAAGMRGRTAAAGRLGRQP